MILRNFFEHNEHDEHDVYKEEQGAMSFCCLTGCGAREILAILVFFAPFVNVSPRRQAAQGAELGFLR